MEHKQNSTEDNFVMCGLACTGCVSGTQTSGILDKIHTQLHANHELQRNLLQFS